MAGCETPDHGSSVDAFVKFEKADIIVDRMWLTNGAHTNSCRRSLTADEARPAGVESLTLLEPSEGENGGEPARLQRCPLRVLQAVIRDLRAKEAPAKRLVRGSGQPPRRPASE